MPVQPQEDDENDEQLENEERELPPSPPMDEGNTKFFVDDKLCSYDSDNEEEYQPMPNDNIIDNNFDDDEEYGLDMFYDSTLDDGPMLIDNPPCLAVITLCEDKNDILAACDNTLTYESPTLFLNSPIHTMEEKLLYVEKYLCGLKLSCTNNHSTHNHHVYDVSCNYFERGKHANILHDSFNNPLYVPKFAKLHQSNSCFIKFGSTTCNYYERGRKTYIYVSMLFKMQPTDHYMHWLPQNCCYLFIYKMPMHRKGVRLKS
jgi:hypothetical protein